MTSEMMPCPFCGETARKHGVETLADNGGWHVGCFKCGATIEMPYRTASEAIAAWNTRTPAPAGELAALAEAWVEADGEAQRIGGAGADRRASAARAAFHTALAAHLAEVRAAIGPVAEAVADISEARPDWLNLFGFHTVQTRLTVGDLRRLAALAKKLEG